MPKKQRERRRRGDGTVSVAKRDASGKPILWKASISLGTVTIDGKARRNRPTEYADTEKEAHQKLKRLQAMHLTGDDMAPDKQTVEAFLIRWLAHIKLMLTPGAYGVYESRCRVHIIPAIGGIKLKTLKTPHVQTMLDALVARGLEPNTVKGVRRTIVRALNVARKWGDVKANVAEDTETPPVIEQKPLVLSEGQLDRLLEIISGDPLEDVVKVALSTGARIGECLGLLWANIDYDAKELHITGAVKRYRLDQPQDGTSYAVARDRYTKTKDERDQYLPEPLASVFRARWKRQQDMRKAAGTAWREQGLIFTDAQGGPLNPNTVSHNFDKIVKRAGLPRGFSFHNLRHACATFLIKQGEQQRTVMEILGHRNERTTLRYGTVLPEVSREALDKHSQRLTRRGGQNEQ
jgi:integrase